MCQNTCTNFVELEHCFNWPIPTNAHTQYLFNMNPNLTEESFTKAVLSTKTGRRYREAFQEVKKYKLEIKLNPRKALDHFCKAFLIEYDSVVADEEFLIQFEDLIQDLWQKHEPLSPPQDQEIHSPGPRRKGRH